MQEGMTMAGALGSASIFDDIQAGYWDEGLEALAEAIRARREWLKSERGARNMLEFKHGDAVRLHNLSPKYMNGRTGTVVKDRISRRRGDIMVRIDDRYYRGRITERFAQVVGVPAANLERV
jgi:hypothetical protein